MESRLSLSDIKRKIATEHELTHIKLRLQAGVQSKPKTVEVNITPEALAPFNLAFLDRLDMYHAETKKEYRITIIGVIKQKDEDRLCFYEDNNLTFYKLSNPEYLTKTKISEAKNNLAKLGEEVQNYVHPILEDYVNKLEFSQETKKSFQLPKIGNLLKFKSKKSSEESADDLEEANLFQITKTL